MVTERCSCEQLMLDEQLTDVPYCRPPTDSSGLQEGIEGGGKGGGAAPLKSHFSNWKILA